VIKKTGDLVIVVSDGKNRSNFQEIEIESNGVYLELLNPKCHEKTITLYKSCKLVEKLNGLYRDV